MADVSALELTHEMITFTSLGVTIFQTMPGLISYAGVRNSSQDG